MKAGNYGNLLVQIEQPRGEYAVTIAFLRLLTTLVKVVTPVLPLTQSFCILCSNCHGVLLLLMSRVSLAALRTEA